MFLYARGNFQSKSLENIFVLALKKIVFSKVAQSRSQKFLPKREIGEKHNFHLNIFIGIFQGFWLQIS